MGRSPDGVSPCVKWTLFAFNILVLLTGLVALGVGLYSRFVTNNWSSVADISSDPAIILIVVGVICSVLGMCGTIGALRENVLLLKIYYFGIVIIILMELVAGVLAFVFQDQLQNQAINKMLDGVRMYRNTNEATNLDDAVEALQETLSCCGARNPRDWIENNIYHNCTQQTFRRVLSACGVPSSCCRQGGSSNSQCGYIVYPYPGMSDAERMMWPSIGMRDTLIFTEGCSTALRSWIVRNYALLGGIAAGILLLQLVTVFMAISMKDSIENIVARYEIDPGLAHGYGT